MDDVSFFYPLLALAMGIGGYWLTHVIRMWYVGGYVPGDCQRWIVELDATHRDIIAAETNRAFAYQRLTQLLGQVPTTLHPAMLAALKLSPHIGRAVLSRLHQSGEVPDDIFEITQEEQFVSIPAPVHYKPGREILQQAFSQVATDKAQPWSSPWFQAPSSKQDQDDNTN